MSKGIFIIGTDTDVGKTIISAGILYLIKKNKIKGVYFKGVLSGAYKKGEKLIPGDAEFVCNVSGIEESYENMVPYIYEAPVSPHLAGKLHENIANIKYIEKKLKYLEERYDYIVAEGSGGILCPIAEGKSLFMLQDIIKLTGFDIVLVARAGVGTINHTVLTVKYAQSIGLNIKGIIINGYIKNNIAHKDNIRMIENLTQIKIVGIIEKIENKRDNSFIKEVRKQFENNIDIDAIIN